MKNKPLLQEAATLLLISVLVSGCGTGRSNPSGETIHVRLSDNDFAVPVGYLANYGTQVYRGGSDADALLMDFEWPSLNPYIDPRDNSPTSIRYKNSISVILNQDSSFDGSTVTVQGPRHLAYYLFGELAVHAGEKYGLHLYFNPASISSYDPSSLLFEPYLYFYPSRENPRTSIQCAPDYIFEISDDITLIGQKVIPYCRHSFHIEGIPKISVQMSYRRLHLDKWREIESKIGWKIKSFLMSGAGDVPPDLGSLY